MGSHMSKRPGESSAAISSIQIATELNSYEAACKVDEDLQSFDSSLHARTNHVISTLAAGVEVRALSFDSLKEVTGCLLEMNQEVVKVILECKKDIWKNQELFELVEEYFENSLKTLDFCAALEKCLKRARDSQLLIMVALQQFEEENIGVEGNKYTRTLDELKNFKAAGDPFTEEFFQIFQSVYRQQMLMLEKLQTKKNKLDKKLKYIHAWRKVSSIIFVATFAAVLICSVVAAAMAAPPVAAALAAATSIPLGSMGKWIDSLFKNYEMAIKGQKEIINYMQVGTYVTIKDLDSIRVLIDRLEIEIEALLANTDFATTDDAAVKIGIEEIKKKLDAFMKNVEDLGVQADVCSRDIRRARTVVLQRIIKNPNN
ncbi:OLC1v1003144C1 [Oldenlandia corymbosa var. corymbosa]|uniref:OLC1v1003144C1 n=1 Tax=Oldenlandia corymbosa var. corymbosa TaxID=529605 RepID=A0AAV1DA13_OLDCO|nr:OLC1v1003144C1 [Oldenlandia corymbosa var. corymbosa]